MAAVQTETLVDRAAAVLSARRLADADTPAMLMVSGGSDSTALAYIAVSYTHLREYANVGADELDGLLRKANEEHAEIVRLFELRDGEEPVSYTHLDVYKRQAGDGQPVPVAYEDGARRGAARHGGS